MKSDPLYPQDFAQRVGFDRILRLAERGCLMELARRKVAQQPFMTDVAEVERALERVDEMRVIQMMEGDFPEEGFVDTVDFLARVRAEGTFLVQAEMVVLRRALIGVEKAVKYLRRNGRYPALETMAEGVVLHPEVVKEIERIVDDAGEVRDGASPRLSEIRGAIRSAEKEAAKRIQAVLRSAKASGIVEEDANLSVRDGKVLLPVNAAAKNKIKGLVYDESATGKTVYIEPLEVVEINNRITELRHSEGREIVRILTEFTDSVRPIVDELSLPNEFMADLDVVRTKARMAMTMGAGKPIVTPERYLNLRAARHPVLEATLKREGREIVPLDLRLDAKKHILVISGPNAGGKSVCLKTTGIIQLMTQTGFLVPAGENSEIPVFDSLFIDIGDQQSIDNDLSTYSSHLLNMKTFLRHSDERSLVLIDEFGTGTEPALGGAIAETVLGRLEKKGVFGVITTHYSNIKYFAARAKGVVNGAMAFDVQKITPLFRLEMGKPGSSFAFEIARKIGLPEDVLKEAQGKVGESQVSLEKQLREIARDKNYWATKREKIKKSDRRYEEVVGEYEEALKELKAQRAVIIKQARTEAEALLSETNRRIENTIREIRESQAERGKTKETRAALEEFRGEVETEEDLRIDRKIAKLKENQRIKEEQRGAPEKKGEIIKPAERGFEVGDSVRMKGQNVAGKILEINKKRITVAFGQLSTTVAEDKIEHISNAEYRKQLKERPDTFRMPTIRDKGYDTGKKRLQFKPEIDLRGARVDEALEEVREFIDEALMFGVSDLRILHGKGTGALKDEIRRYLRTVPEVASAADEHVERGGAGITVVKLGV